MNILILPVRGSSPVARQMGANNVDMQFLRVSFDEYQLLSELRDENAG